MPGTGLANFREQYPQYSSIDDEELAGLVKDKFYPDMDAVEYRDQMGLAPPPEPPKPPTMWDRVKSSFSTEEEKPGAILSDAPKLSEEFDAPDLDESPPEPPSALLRDQFFAGWDEYRANRSTAASFGAIEDYGRVENIATGHDPGDSPSQFAGMSNFARNARAEAGDAVAQKQIADEVDSQRTRLTNVLQASIDKRRDLMDRTRFVPYSTATQEMLEAKGFGESMDELWDEPVKIMAEISLRSLPNMADAVPLMVAGGLAGGPFGLAAGAGAGAGMAEYRASFADSLQQQGVDLTSAESMMQAADSPDIMLTAHNYARTRSAIIGTASTLSGGLATKPLTPFVKNVVARELSNVAVQIGAQGTIEGIGEASAQLATTGEISGGEVLAESIGGAITAPIDVGTAVVSGVRAQRVHNEVARIESEVNDMLDVDVPRETESTNERFESVLQQQAVAQQIEDARAEHKAASDEFQNLSPDQQADEHNDVVQRMESAGRRLKRLEAYHDQLTATARPETTDRGPAPTQEQPKMPKSVIPKQAQTERERDAAAAQKGATDHTETATEAPNYVDQRLRSRPVRDQLLQDAQDLGVDVPARRAQKAAQRAVTGRSLSEGQTRVVQAMLEQEPDVLESRRADPRVDEDRRATDRRKGDRRQQVRSMSMDELVSAIYTDKLTGIANERAFADDLPNHAWLAEIDADSLKWINDNLSEDAGDAMLVAVAEALEQTDVDAYRVGGDEFWLGGDSKESVQAAVELAKSVLANQKVSTPKGQSTGIGITYGLGQSREVASATMKQHKERRASVGKRAKRGEAPKNTTLSVKAAKVLDMAPGTNYVSMIGHTGALPIDANNNLILGNGRAVRIPKTPVRREHILAVMQKALGLQIYQGRVKGKTRLGFYRPGHGEIRIKNANDIEVAAHEVAHWLDDRYPWIERLYKGFAAEVKSVSYDVSMITEGWAEFMRLYMTQESEAIKRTPAFYDAFQKELATHPKLQGMVHDVQELMHAWTQQGARARLASKHGVTEASIYERMRMLFRTNVWQSGLDGLRAVKEIGKDVTGVTTAYKKLRLALGGSNGVLEAAMFYGTPGWREDGQGLEFNGESLKGIWGDFWGDNDVALYMMARRGQELHFQGRENLMRPDEIASGLRIADEKPGVVAAFQRFQAFNQRMLDFAEGSGILGEGTRALIEEMNKSYVPFHRVIDSEIDNRNVKGGGNPFQRLKGGTQNVANIWDNIVNNNGMMIRMALVNDGKRSLLKILGGTDSLGAGQRNQAAGKYAAPISTREAPVKIQSQQVIRKMVEAMGMNWGDYRMAKDGMVAEGSDGDAEMAIVAMVSQMKHGMSEMVEFFQTGLDPTGNVDYYLQDGKKVWFEIADAGLYESLQFLGPKPTNLLLQILGGFSGMLRRGVVAMPVFQVKNLVRDSINAWLLSDHVKVPAARALKAVFSRIEEDPAYQEMFLNGGGFANRSQGLQAQRKVVINPLRMAATYDRFMGRFENANRLAEYKAAREAGVSPREAALLSREISTDFAMRGSSDVARWLAISVPFLNARAQGIYRVKRQFDTRQHALSYAIRGSAMMAATVALYALNKDDERYKELPEDIKDLNWVHFTGEGESDYFLVPKPFESGMLWGTIPERMFEYTESENGKEFADAMGWMFLQTFSMDMVPQVFQPEVDLQRNKKFTGAPIIPFYLDNVEPSQQYTWYTSETTRQAGKMFGISPIKLEHRIRGYLGTMGTYALGASDAMIRAATDSDERAFGEDPTRGDSWKENIIVRGLIDPLVGEGPPRRSKYVTDLYEMIREAQLVANTADLMVRRQNAEVEDYLADPLKQAEFAASAALNDARKGLGEIRKQMDLVRMSKDLSGDEKRAQLWELTRTRNQLGRDAVIAIQQAQDRIESEQRRATNER